MPRSAREARSWAAVIMYETSQYSACESLMLCDTSQCNSRAWTFGHQNVRLGSPPANPNNPTGEREMTDVQAGQMPACLSLPRRSQRRRCRDQRGHGVTPSEIRPLRLRFGNEVVLEVVAVVFGADRFCPDVGIAAPALGHIHRFVERALVLDLDEGFQEFVIRRHLEA